MDAQTPTPEPVPFRAPEGSLGGVDSRVVASALAAASDVALVLDGDGVIQDMAIGSADLAEEGAGDWLGKRWEETVLPDSRHKVLEMLSDGASPAGKPWRQINQRTERGEFPLRYIAIRAGPGRGTIAVGRDARGDAALQQRLIQAQQMIERERLRARQTETRYRLLFSLGREAIIVLDAGSRTIIEANPAAERLLGRTGLAGRPLLQLVEPSERDALLAMLGAIGASDQAPPVRLRLGDRTAPVRIDGNMFRQGGNSYVLLRLADEARIDEGRDAAMVLERVPDPFVVTDSAFRILDVNAALLELLGHARKEELIGCSLGQFLGRPGIDFAVLSDQLIEHGLVRNLVTIVRPRFGAAVEVQVSAVLGTEGGHQIGGFTLRPLASDRTKITAEMASPRSVEELTELVGRMTLKDIVRESTDLIERLCIEAALKCADNNRASAAEILGLSRQGLYLKLHRHGLARDPNDDRQDRAR
ncbi:transcriptional regulator PpsR [Thermaurantiacus sp.]